VSHLSANWHDVPQFFGSAVFEVEVERKGEIMKNKSIDGPDLWRTMKEKGIRKSRESEDSLKKYLQFSSKSSQLSIDRLNDLVEFAKQDELFKGFGER